MGTRWTNSGKSADGSGSFEREEVDPTPDTGHNSAIIAIDGLPAIAYYDTNDPNLLKYAVQVVDP